MKKRTQEILEVGKASQHVLNMLLEYGFRQIGFPVEDGRWSPTKFRSGEIQHFMKNGECRITFLKDGRIHVLNGPEGRWKLYEFVSESQWKELIYFCSLSAESQNLRRALRSGGIGVDC